MRIIETLADTSAVSISCGGLRRSAWCESELTSGRKKPEKERQPSA
uniref:Uncharacterized protein n=1 Tax=Physcomitrium patens TaxID=3218 RepID=A0A2K1K1Y1_PHYPA|nr:hypothetical protein PHYPA_012262 [Physcomitrium patens]